MTGLAAALAGVISATGRGPAVLFSGLFKSEGFAEWPHGVQEPDAPHFAVEHADSLRPRAEIGPEAEGMTADIDADLDGEIIELFNRRLT
jgi:hypothetical protein